MIDIAKPLYYGDVIAKQGVELKVRQDGLVIWLNVDGVCITRIITNGFVSIIIDDERKDK